MWVPFRPRASSRGRPTHRRRWRTVVALVAGLGLTSPWAAAACDLCAIYTATEVQQARPGFRLGVAEQFTHFGTRQDSGRVIDDGGESMDSSITQLLLGYNFNERFGVQANLPIISRNFERLTADGLEKDDETGLGDLSLIASFAPQPWVWADGLIRVSVFGGIKLPTGSSDRLREEVEVDDGHGDSPFRDIDGDGVPDFPDVPGRGLPFAQSALETTGNGNVARPPAFANHTTGGAPPSAIHGHDLSLGSGSVDGVIGANLFGSWKRLYANAAVQYFLRSQGSFNYEYANELLWRFGPGVFLALDDIGLERGYTVGLATVFSGETKGLDTLSGAKLADTGYTGLYLGPALNFTWGESLQINLAGDIPVKRNNSDVQIVPDFRIRGGLTWRF